MMVSNMLRNVLAYVLKSVIFDDLYEKELNDLNRQVRAGIIPMSERSIRRESLIVENLLKDYNEEGMSRITNEELLEMDARYWCRQPLKIRLTLPMHIKSVRKSSWRLQTARWPQTLTGYSRKRHYCCA